MPVLDTTFLIDLQRAPKKTVPLLDALLARDEALFVPMQAAVEYCAGRKDAAKAFHDLGASFTLLPFDEEMARHATDLARRALLAGSLPGWADVQIAAAARLHGTYVVTRDARHFRDGLDVPVWDYSAEAEPPK